MNAQHIRPSTPVRWSARYLVVFVGQNFNVLLFMCCSYAFRILNCTFREPWSRHDQTGTIEFSLRCVPYEWIYFENIYFNNNLINGSNRKKTFEFSLMILIPSDDRNSYNMLWIGACCRIFEFIQFFSKYPRILPYKFWHLFALKLTWQCRLSRLISIAQQKTELLMTKHTFTPILIHCLSVAELNNVINSLTLVVSHFPPRYEVQLTK